MHKLYKITNKVNEKLYIGITKLSLDQRWSKHVKDSENPQYPLHRAIKKYGAENFTIETLIESDDRSFISSIEEPTIQALNSRTHGYNVATGGYGGDLGPEANEKRRQTKLNFSQEKKERIAEAARRCRLGMTLEEIYGEEKGKLIRQKMSALQKERGGYGPKSHSLNTKIKMSQKGLGKLRNDDTRQKMTASAKINNNGKRFNIRVCCLCCQREWDIGNYTQHLRRNHGI